MTRSNWDRKRRARSSSFFPCGNVECCEASEFCTVSQVVGWGSRIWCPYGVPISFGGGSHREIVCYPLNFMSSACAPVSPTERSTPPAQGSDDYPDAKSSQMQKRRCYQRRSGALNAWNRPTSTGTGGSDPLWLCWRGKPCSRSADKATPHPRGVNWKRQLILGHWLSPIATPQHRPVLDGAASARCRPRATLRRPGPPAAR
jgi:hypothetical protein